jgi:predicted Zn-dependent peptidase
LTKEHVHELLPGGLEFGLVRLPERHVVSFQIRVLAGTTAEPAQKLGLARLVEDTIDKGTQQRSAQELSDVFDTIGAGRNSGTGRETTTYTCTVLPQHFEQAVALHAEFLKTPTFPDDMCATNVELARQELIALDDDPHGLVDKYIGRQAFGPVLGRHPIGEPETIAGIARDDLEDYWRRHYRPGRMIVAVAGPLEPQQVRDVLGRHLDGPAGAPRDGREPTPAEFAAHTRHYDKELEQEHIGICWPGVDATHDDFPIQQVVLGILSGGMSGRLFTEVREKRGLVYWVSAWHETPRGIGMMFLGASTTSQRCDQTYDTLLREVDRLAEDIEPDELDRAKTGIIAQKDTRGDLTRARCTELANDLFFFGRPVPLGEKVAKIEAVTNDDIRRYLSENPRDALCVVTLGPRPLTDAAAVTPRSEEIGTRS